MAPSNAAVTAALTGAGGTATAPPFPGRPAPAVQDMVGNGAVAAAGRGRVTQAPTAPAGKAVAPPAQAKEAEAPSPPGPKEAETPAALGPKEAEAPTAPGAKEAKARPGPHADPKFAALKKDVRHKKRSLAASHPPPRAEAAAAQDAALPPKDDEEAQGKAANAEKMNEARPKEFDKDAFIRAVEKAIADRAPKNLDEADKFAGSGKADEIRAEVHGRVGDGKADSAEQIATTTAAPPDTSAAVPKKVVPMSADRPPGTPGAPDPAQAVPDRLPASATDMSAGPAEIDRRMADAQVTEAQLRKSNEPGFTRALGEKKAAERHSDTAPGRLRKHEAAELRASTAQAKRLGTAAMSAMGAQRVRTGQQVDTGKAGAKSRDEEKRAQVTAVLQGVFDTMKKDVEAILEGLDKLVDDQFGRGEKAAREAFTAEHRRKMDEYKDRRYSGATGKLRWVRDLFAGLPAEADKIFEEARDTYVRRMRQVITDVADTIGAELNRAKRRIAQGRAEMRDAVRRLPADLRAVGQRAAAEFAGKFDELTQAVDDKGTQLVDTLATKYTEALKSVDDEIAAEKEKNKGLVAKAVNAVKAVINTILELKRLLLAVLAKAAQAVMLILKDPIGFLRNLVSAVGAGLRRFLQNIGRHLQQGILSWLLGRTAEAGIEVPAKFDTQGVVRMVAGLLGLTWQNIRGRITRKVPEPAVAAAETAVPLLADVRKRGVTAMWEDVRPRVGDLKRKLLDDVIKYVTPTIVVAGIMWVISLLNPASAFVRAVKLIIDFIRFIVTQARQIFDFVNAVLDAVIAIARGGSGGVPALIERALARSIPVLLGVLAAILGVGGIAARVRQIVQRLSAPVNRAVDWVIDKIVGLVKKLWSKLKSKPAKKKTPEKPTTERPKKPTRRPRGPRRPDRRRPKQRKDRPDRRKGREDRRKEAQQKKDRELPVVLAKAKAIAEQHEKRGESTKALLAALAPLKRRYSWVRSFLVEGKGPFKVWLLASKHSVDANYSPFLSEKEVKQLVFSALHKVRGEILTQRKEAGRTEPKKDDELHTQVERMFSRVTAAYEAACRPAPPGADPTTYTGNVFTFGGHEYFVDHDNNYIVPKSRVEKAVNDNGKIKVENRGLLDEYRYGNFGHSPSQMRDMAVKISAGARIKNENDVNMMLAALVAEARRNPISHVTNLLLLKDASKLEGTFYKHAPMTGGGTDNPEAPRDPDLTGTWEKGQPQPPVKVTDAEYAMVRRLYEKEIGESMLRIEKSEKATHEELLLTMLREKTRLTWSD
ncbi:hypothetical protein RND61_24895 [Streptomyces sp. TRM76323]|uniref:HPC2 multi-domain protein n=1 Tax=Streptomyces tamarix TaxID=3078565 RepID=A0ABU3QR69_9ACTN|nr:hypothetical protein [Streptomyces tamarix]MDT9685275.1 hypothetical protein [Streptomyces tamarix]